MLAGEKMKVHSFLVVLALCLVLSEARGRAQFKGKKDKRGKSSRIDKHKAVTPGRFDCGEPEVVSGGSRSFPCTLKGCVAKYTCNPGYKLVGHKVRTCLGNGHWSGSPPSCTINCGKFLESGECDIPLVDSVDLEKYQGRWFQAAASPLVYDITIPNGTCVTATYGIKDPMTLTVYNTNNRFFPGSSLGGVRGIARLTEQPGRLTVQFTSDPGNYWILKLGPAVFGKTGQYAYSIISEPRKLFLFIIVRDIHEYYKYEAEILEFIEFWGYSNSNSPPNGLIPTLQTEDCIYPPPPQPPRRHKEWFPRHRRN